jgi:hypothetical protein
VHIVASALDISDNENYSARQMQVSNCLLNTVSGLLLLFIAPVTHALPIPAEKDHVISLDGVWRFKLERPATATTKPARPGLMVPVDTPSIFEPFNTPDYQEDGNWHDLAVPGNWEMAGFSPATYNQPDNASGF